MGMPAAVLAGLMATGLLAGAAMAETAPAAGGPAAPAEVLPPVPAGEDGELSHSALKGLTYMAAVTASDLTVLSIASGGVVAGTALTLFCTGASLAVYAVNDYVWGQYAPPPVRKEAEVAFDLQDEVWLASGKFLTYTVSTLWVKAIKLASLYAYTVSAGTAMVATSISVLLNAGYFYANSIGWDYYDRPAAPTPAGPSLTSPPEVAGLAEAASDS